MAHPIPSRRIPWHLILIFLFFSLGIISIGYFYYYHEQAFLKQEKLDDLKAIADMKIKQIVEWRWERLGDATLIMKDSFLAARIKDWLESRDKSELRNEILHRLKALMVYQYQNIALLDPEGRVRMSVLKEDLSLATPTKELLLEAMQTRRLIFSDLYKIPNSQVIRLSIVVPILLSQGTQEVPVGAILIWIDPHQFLYPLIQSWPTPSHSGETVLIRREGNKVVILNDLRNRKDTALTLHYSLQEAKLPAVMAAKGKEGAVEGKDYRGVPVVAAVGRIPDSPWYFVAKIDAAEIYAPLRQLNRLVLFFIIVLIAAVLGTLVAIWRNQQMRFYRRQYEMDREREEALKNLNEELEQRVKERTAELEYANREMESFSYSVSHDLKAPVRAIQGFSQMLMVEHADRLDPEGLRLLKVVTDNTKVMHHIIDDLMALSRLGRLEIRKGSVNLTSMARQVFDRLREQTPERDVQLIMGDLPQGRGDQSLLYQVMENLLNNAIKYTRSGKTAVIEVGGKDEENETIYYVKDNGVGYDERYADKLFSPFQRLHSHEEYEGAGVGLAIVKRIIERHGGRVWAEGKVNEGAIFYFALPKNGGSPFSGGWTK